MFHNNMLNNSLHSVTFLSLILRIVHVVTVAEWSIALFLRLVSDKLPVNWGKAKLISSNINEWLVMI